MGGQSIPSTVTNVLNNRVSKSQAKTKHSLIPMALAILISNKNHQGHLGFVRDLTENEIQTHLAYTPLCAGIRNLATTYRMVESAITDWDNHISAELSSQHAFSNLAACYKFATLLSMLYMLDEHVECETKRLERKNMIKSGEFEFWLNLRNGDGFLSLMRNMRNASQHVGLPIESYTKRHSSAGITLEIIFVAGEKGKIIDHNSFREKLGAFMEDVGRQQLIPKLKEALNVAHSFYSSLMPNAHKRFPEKLVLIGEVSERTDDTLNASLLEVPGRFFEDLNLGFSPPQ